MSYNYRTAQLADVKDLILHVTTSKLALIALDAVVSITGGEMGRKEDGIRSFGMSIKFLDTTISSDMRKHYCNWLQSDLSAHFNAIIFVDEERSNEAN